MLMLRLVLALSVLSSSHLLLASSVQTCKEHTFANEVFDKCRDLPQLSSFLYWTYEQASGKLELAYRHAGINSTNRWVAWAINPNNNLTRSMPGAQALVAIPQSSGAPRVYTSSISGYSTQLPEGNISYPHSNLTATYQNNEVTIFATLTLPNGTASLVHLWQDGPLNGSTPQIHALDYANLNSKETLNLVSST